MASLPLNPRYIVQDGQATGVILDIDVYEQLLERIEQREDLAAIAKMSDHDRERVSLADYQAGQDKPHTSD